MADFISYEAMAEQLRYFLSAMGPVVRWMGGLLVFAYVIRWFVSLRKS